MSTQPVEVYPNSVPKQPSSHSNGSFGPAFIILAIILVISVIACVVGRLCSRRHHDSKPKQTHAVRSKERGGPSRQNHDFQPREGDIEFGFDKTKPSSKVAASEGFREFKPSNNGEGKGQVRFADNIEFKPVTREGQVRFADNIQFKPVARQH